jgi:uncharacterized membrane protein YphA (DoxX/SURF4 family)
MKPRQAAALAARLIVGAILVYAGASKASAPAEEFAYVIQAYDLVPMSIALPMAGMLPWLELLVGWSLILGVETQYAAAAGIGMFGLFLTALGSVVVRGVTLPNCGCFGDAMHFTPGQAFLFDSLMIALCWIVFRGGLAEWSLDSWQERGL